MPRLRGDRNPPPERGIRPGRRKSSPDGLNFSGKWPFREGTGIRYAYPTPRDLGLTIPPNLLEDRFNQGFEHALKGGKLKQAEHFRLSFRMGFRAAKLYLRQYRRSRGIIEFPMRARFKVKVS